MLTKFWRYSTIHNLTLVINQSTGRNNHGRTTIHHRGGGAKKRFRFIDYHRQFLNIPALLIRLERAHLNRVIALLCYSNGILSYIIATKEFPKYLYSVFSEMRRVIMTGYTIPNLSGNTKPTQLLPLGVDIHNVGGQFVRTPAGRCQILRRTKEFSFIRLPSRRVTFNS
jgi:large subunit ribosomal protein L2